MKKHYYSLLCGAMMLAGGLHAQTGSLVLTLPETVLEYDILHVSSNGKWACGVINNGTFSGWVWNLTTGELTELTQVGIASTAWQVSNDGTVAGTFMDSQATGNGAQVESSGYWKAGKWHSLASKGSQVTTYNTAGTAYAISPNGQYIGGQVSINGVYTPVIWNNGEMTVLPNYAAKSQAGSVLGVDDKGNASGWTYKEKTNSTTINRTAALWLPDLTIPLPDVVNGWCEVRLSPNGRYAIVNGSQLYDTTTKEFKKLDLSSAFNVELCAVSDDGTIVGLASGDMTSAAGCIVVDGQLKDINTYLKEKGVDLGDYKIAQVFGISADAKTFGAMAYDMSFNGDDGAVRVVPIVVKLDQNVTTREPAGVDALVLDGANAVKLDWRKPLAGADGVKSYELYRDGKQIQSFDANVLTFTDTNVSKGDHSYTVKSVYATATSEPTEAVEVAIADKQPSQPSNVMALQARINDVRLLWDAPYSSLPSLQYYTDGDDVSGIGWNTYSLESGIKFTADMLAAYGQSAKMEGVTFYPMSAQKGWAVHIYDATNTDTPLYTEKINSDNLKYGEKNTVKFSSPIAIPAGKDLIVAIEATVDKSSEPTANVLGRITGKKRIGYTDLMRRVGVDKDFFSMYELSMSREGNAAEDNTTWPLGALISMNGESEKTLEHYEVWEDDKLIQNTNETNATIKEVGNGRHTYDLTAVYTDGSKSDKASATVTVNENTTVFDISNLKATANGLKVTTTWNAPVNDDATSITYATGDESGNGLTGSSDYNYSYTVGAKYVGRMLKAYKGYEIKSLRFFPLAKAYFSFTLTENGKEVAYKEVDDAAYTIGQWNTINLDKAITLNPNAEYLLALECFEPEDGKAPIGLDKYMAHAYVGDLYKQGESAFSAMSSTSEGFVGNWMIGMVVGTPESESLPIKGYNVRTGSTMTGETLLTEQPITTTSFDYTFDKAGTYTLRVSPVYDQPIGERKGQNVVVRVTGADGINTVTTDKVKVYPNPATTYVKADGDVRSITAYSMSGAQVAHAEGNTLNVESLPEGIYLIKVTTSEGDYNTKVNKTK